MTNSRYMGRPCGSPIEYDGVQHHEFSPAIRNCDGPGGRDTKAQNSPPGSASLRGDHTWTTFNPCIPALDRESTDPDRRATAGVAIAIPVPHGIPIYLAASARNADRASKGCRNGLLPAVTGTRRPGDLCLPLRYRHSSRLRRHRTRCVVAIAVIRAPSLTDFGWRERRQPSMVSH